MRKPAILLTASIGREQPARIAHKSATQADFPTSPKRTKGFRREVAAVPFMLGDLSWPNRCGLIVEVGRESAEKLPKALRIVIEAETEAFRTTVVARYTYTTGPIDDTGLARAAETIARTLSCYDQRVEGRPMPLVRRLKAASVTACRIREHPGTLANKDVAGVATIGSQPTRVLPALSCEPA